MTLIQLKVEDPLSALTEMIGVDSALSSVVARAKASASSSASDAIVVIVSTFHDKDLGSSVFLAVTWCVNLITKHTQTFSPPVLHLLVCELPRRFLCIVGKG